MKKVIFAISVIAATVFGLSSCQREQAVQDEMPSGKKVTISFIAEKAGVDTKTAAIEEEKGVSYKWTEEDRDNIKLFSVNDDDGSLTEITDITPSFSEDYRILTISAEVVPETYTFRAMLSGDWTNNGDKPRIKPTQIPNGTENFDPTADVLVSDDFEVSVGEEAEEPMLLTFRRQVVVNKMTLKKLTSGEKVKKVTIKSDKHLTGYLEKGKMYGQQRELSLSYSNEVVPDSGEFDVYFVTMENTDQKLTVEVTTDQYSYAKTFDNTINFYLGQFTKFGVALPDGEPVVDFVAGDYFITSAYNSTVYAAKAYNTGNNYLSNPLTINVNVDEGSIVYQNDIEDCIFSIRPVSGEETHEGEFTIQDANGLYLYAAGGNSNNQLKGEAAPDTNGNAYWKIEKNPDGTYSVTSQGSATRNTLQFNFNSNNPIFSCYSTNNQTAITLYPAEWCKIDETPVVTIAEEERTKTVTSAATSVNFAYNANRYATEPLTVTVSSDVNKIIADDAPVVENGIITVSLNPNTENIVKTASLTVNGDGLEDAPVTLTITQEAYAEWKAGSETFDLTTDSYSSASASSVTWTGSSTIIKYEKAPSSNVNANNYLGGTNSYTHTRFYSGHTISIVPQNGYIITSVVFTATEKNYALKLETTNATASDTDNIVTVTPADGASPITATVSATCRLTSIVVNYLTLGSGEEGGNGGGTTEPEQPSETKIAKLTGDDMSVMSEAGTAYNTIRSVNVNGFVWETNGFQDGKYTNMIQLRARNNNSGVTYLKLPDFDGFIKSITLIVTDGSATSSSGKDPSTTIAFQNGKDANDDIVVSGTATNNSITLNLSDQAVKTGYIVSSGSGAFRIWEVSVEYN